MVFVAKINGQEKDIKIIEDIPLIFLLKENDVFTWKHIKFGYTKHDLDILNNMLISIKAFYLADIINS